jgi:hypothetical protein
MNRMAVRILALDFIGAWPAACRLASFPAAARTGAEKRRRAGRTRVLKLPAAVRGCPRWRGAVVRGRRVGRDRRPRLIRSGSPTVRNLKVS